MVGSRRRRNGAGTNPGSGSPALAGASPPFAGVLAALAICSHLYPRRLQPLILFMALFCFILLSPGKSRRGAALSHGRALIFSASSAERCCRVLLLGCRDRGGPCCCLASPPWGLAVPCAHHQRPKLQTRWRSWGETRGAGVEPAPFGNQVCATKPRAGGHLTSLLAMEGAQVIERDKCGSGLEFASGLRSFELVLGCDFNFRGVQTQTARPRCHRGVPRVSHQARSSLRFFSL